MESRASSPGGQTAYGNRGRLTSNSHWLFVGTSIGLVSTPGATLDPMNTLKRVLLGSRQAFETHSTLEIGSMIIDIGGGTF